MSDYKPFAFIHLTLSKRIISVVFMVLFFISSICVSAEEASDKEDKVYTDILFISSYHSSFPTIEYQLQGLYEVFNDYDYNMDIEFMDTKRFYTPENLSNFHERMVNKMGTLKDYEVVIAGDDNALQYVMDQRETVFEGLPIVFFGINDTARAEEAINDYGFTGIVETSSVEATLSYATKLFPEAKGLNIIVDASPSGIGELNTVMSFEADFSKLDFIVMSLADLSYDELGHELKALDESEIILLISGYTDVDGNKKSFYEYLDIIKASTDLPVFHLYSFGIGSGLFGGKVVDYASHGREAARIAVRVIEGELTSEIDPILDDSTNGHIYDYREVVRLGLKKGDFPFDAHFVNEPPNFFQENTEIVVISASVFTMLLFIILILSYSFQKSRRAEEKLQASNQELAAMYEEMMAINEELEAQEEELRDSFENLSYKSDLLEESERRYKYVFELSHAGLWERKVKNNSIYLTSEWYRNLFKEKGYNDVEKLGVAKLMDLFYSHLDNVQLNRLQILQEELMNGLRSSYSMVLQCCRKNDKVYFIEERAKAIYNGEGELDRIIGSHTNITSSVMYEQQLEEFAYKDQLTKMPNRIILEQRMDEYLTRRGDEVASGAVLLIDVDNFKFINNTYGHEIGDELLQLIAGRLNDVVGDDHLLGRISGDEFVVICQNLDRRESIEAIASSLVETFDDQFKLRDRSIYVTVSIGISLYPENGSDLDTLLYRCNSAVNEAKMKGKNRFDFYDVSMNETMESRIYIQNNIRQAIEKNLFELHYQPIYSFENDSITGFEALIRWKDEVKGYIPPDEFIVVAEKMGIINRLGEWVLKQAITFIRDFNLTHKTDLYVSINVSSVQLIQHDFVESTMTIIDSLRVPYDHICIELTETALMQSFDQNTEKLSILRDEGLRISLDDFGTGYSSLNYLRRLPVDILKIDKSFIDGLVSSGEDRQLTEGIILLAQKMGIYVIAEGIEERAQLNYLKQYSCDGIQRLLHQPTG